MRPARPGAGPLSWTMAMRTPSISSDWVSGRTPTSSASLLPRTAWTGAKPPSSSSTSATRMSPAWRITSACSRWAYAASGSRRAPVRRMWVSARTTTCVTALGWQNLRRLPDPPAALLRRRLVGPVDALDLGQDGGEVVDQAAHVVGARGQVLMAGCRQLVHVPGRPPGLRRLPEGAHQAFGLQPSQVPVDHRGRDPFELPRPQAGRQLVAVPWLLGHEQQQVSHDEGLRSGDCCVLHVWASPPSGDPHVFVWPKYMTSALSGRNEFPRAVA